MCVYKTYETNTVVIIYNISQSITNFIQWHQTSSIKASIFLAYPYTHSLIIIRNCNRIPQEPIPAPLFSLHKQYIRGGHQKNRDLPGLNLDPPRDVGVSVRARRRKARTVTDRPRASYPRGEKE